MDGGPMDLEEVWRIREEDIYPAMFGRQQRGIFTLDQEFFEHRLNQTDIDPRWLFYGVIEFAPTPTRPSWLYVTSGHSNPWDDEPEHYDVANASGAGVELTFATSEQGDWAIRVLQSLLAYDLLLRVGRFPGGKPLVPGSRVPLGGSMNGRAECLLRNIVVTEAEGFADSFQLPSGQAQFFGTTAITDAELAEARQTSSAELVARLRAAGYHPVNIPARPSLI
jgi:hypothetical protein